MARARARQRDRGTGRGGCGRSDAGSVPQSAAEPGWRLAPRLDHREQDLPGVRRHCIRSGRRDKRAVLVIARVVVCSRAVSIGSRRPVRKAGIAARPVATRLGVGGKSKRAGVIEPAPAVGSDGASSIGVIGSGGVNGQRQLAGRRRARVSAQRVAAKIFWSGCVTGRAVTPFSSCRGKIRAGVFAAWAAAWRCGEWKSGRRVIARGVDVGGASG